MRIWQHELFIPELSTVDDENCTDVADSIRQKLVSLLDEFEQEVEKLNIQVCIEEFESVYNVDDFADAMAYLTCVCNSYGIYISQDERRL